ncbi:hypothetical protein G3578_16970 [Brevibacillus sp. SYP-B805]|uniref:hypothetical protein n=1 Tax=Brevibacillus sp. SYP-B805 TaxID=1578199 RepID=UPI0013ED70B8|nr:hypothetical protein [Brevibacillus sp. SYP-B805]NGQ96859.1 hypothetical protein [Brevibacillus sp. SYP-B805]
MYQYHTNTILNEVQRILNQLQQNERNNANTLRNLAGQLQNLAATENQATAMLQQLLSLTNQLAAEASRATPPAYPTAMPYEPLRTNAGSNVTPALHGSAISAGLQAAASPQAANTPPFGQS